MLDFSHEALLARKGYNTIAGVDEVGRGPWAGPVMAAAVIWPKDIPLLKGVTDSKKLSLAKREILCEQILAVAEVGVGEASVAEIDSHNIRQATFMAMRRAVDNLPQRTDYLFIDGNALPSNLPCDAGCVVKGDGKVYSIACASIVAKVLRDREMQRLHGQFPHYAWDSNAGYGTVHHQQGLESHGVTVHHRRSFAPIRARLEA